MPRYAVGLDVRTSQPLTTDRISALQGGRWEMTALGRPRGRRLTVNLIMDGGDPAGALIRAQNLVFDEVPGEVTRAEVVAIGEEQPPVRRRRRSRA